MPRAQPGRKRLAVYARQLALQPHLQILRRSRRPLLCGLEQARRSALAHHVHRIAPMGARVLIIGIWYYVVAAQLPLTATELRWTRRGPDAASIPQTNDRFPRADVRHLAGFEDVRT